MSYKDFLRAQAEGTFTPTKRESLHPGMGLPLKALQEELNKQSAFFESFRSWSKPAPEWYGGVPIYPVYNLTQQVIQTRKELAAQIHHEEMWRLPPDIVYSKEYFKAISRELFKFPGLEFEDLNPPPSTALSRAEATSLTRAEALTSLDHSFESVLTAWRKDNDNARCADGSTQRIGGL